jgi:hypothetical protein
VQQQKETQVLKENNDAKMALHNEQQQKASAQRAKADAQIENKDQVSTTLTQQLQVWAAEHQAERQRAIAAAKARYETKGYKTTVQAP